MEFIVTLTSQEPILDQKGTVTSLMDLIAVALHSNRILSV
jgi:hypothetical protein